MEKNPKPFVVYWMSQFAGTSRGSNTPRFQPNMMTFETVEQAASLQSKLRTLISEGGPYRGRIVLQVSEINSMYHISVGKLRVEQNADDAKNAIGKTVKANHPITCLNPEEWFVVVDARLENGRIKVIGAETCWFSLDECEIRETDEVDRVRLERIRSIVAAELGWHVSQIDAHSDFVNDLGADSLDLIELCMAIEDEFDCEIPDSDVELCKNSLDVVSVLKKILA